MSTLAKQTATGVEALIARIRDDGVRAAEGEAEEIVKRARAEAADILAEARAQADTLRSEAKAEIEAEHKATQAALRLASRDAQLEMKAQLVAAFERHVQRLVAEQTRDPGFLRELLLTLAGKAPPLIDNRDAQVLLAPEHFDADTQNDAQARSRALVLGVSGDMLREGVSLRPSPAVGGGMKVQLVDEALELDFSEAALSELFVSRLLPRYRNMLEGSE